MRLVRGESITENGRSFKNLNKAKNRIQILGWNKNMSNNAIYYKSLIVFGAAIFIVMLILSPKAYTESASKLKINEDKVRQEMVVISRQLGTTCTECHNVQNFASNEKKSFKIAKEHLRIVETLRNNGFDGKKGPEATCYMCHQGDLHPEYKESLEK
ncbi:MAG: hypothetical protein ACXVB1_04275 [Pseudobdellovibrionaceae bacterium]